MNDERKFYQTIVTYEILSDEPLGSMSLKDIDYECTEGHCSGRFIDTKEVRVSRDVMAKLLVTQGSDPGFLLEEEDE